MTATVSMIEPRRRARRAPQVPAAEPSALADPASEAPTPPTLRDRRRLAWPVIFR